MTMLELDLIFYSKLLLHLQKMRLLKTSPQKISQIVKTMSYFSCVLTSTLMDKW